MEFSLFYFADEGRAHTSDGRYNLLLRGARFADDNGFSAVWTPERHFHPFGGLYPNPAVTGAAITQVTERVHVRAGSVVLPLHDLLRVVEEWSVVDNLSHGRTGLAIASGWHSTDFVLRPESFEERNRIAIDGIQTVRSLWRGEPIRRIDGAGITREITTLPRPVTPEPRLWLTCGGSRYKYIVAGEQRTNVLTHLLDQDVETLTARIADYRAAYTRHDPTGRGHVTLMLHTFLGTDLDSVRETVAEPFKNYLRSSMELTAGDPARAPGPDAKARHREASVRLAFHRYFSRSGLFGSVDDARKVVDRLSVIGVDEVACLIDFGVDPRLVLDSLSRLAELVRDHR